MDYIFRGFHPDKNGTQVVVVSGKEYKGKWIEGDLLSKCKGSPKISINGEYNRGLFVVDSYEVIPETVGQWTGLTDKNGKRIFEGDMVKDNYGNKGFVFYSEHFSRWQIRFTSGRDDLVNYGDIGVHIFSWIYPKIELEVIGNKWEE